MRRLFPFALAADQRGAAIIELALIAPVLALGVIGIVDMSNAYSRKLALEQGAQRAIEKIMQTTANDTVENTLATEACDQIDGMDSSGNCKNTPITTANVTVSWRKECTASGGGVTTTSYTTAAAYDNDSNLCSGSGSIREADYIQVAVTSTYSPMFPIHFASYNGTAYPISATAGMRIK